MSKLIDALRHAPGVPEAIVSTLIEGGKAGNAQACNFAMPAAEQPPAAVAAREMRAARCLKIHINGSSPLLPFDNTHWYAAEQYRMVRTRILHHALKPKTILVTSAESGDGKSVSAINIAGAMSLKSESKILLMDCDFRRPSVHKQVGFPEGPGLIDVLARGVPVEEALIRVEQFANLYVLTTGSTSDNTLNPAELLDSDKWRATIAQLRASYGHIIMDSPPVGCVADFDLLQTLADGVIMVVRPDHTRRSLFMKTLDVLPRQKLLGVVLNCVEDWFLARPYYYKMTQRYWGGQ